ncbi:GntR family transcriptional regulator [Streptomyces sp. NPDC050485]|uniref:GntR family transcriptional regulator n=1 Tax=Streptomyces sp. NPDC050485 TaxID=3365617 RepID=UPI003793502B
MTRLALREEQPGMEASPWPTARALDFETDGRYAYLQIADFLRRDITSGRLRAGMRVPTARMLQEEFGTASVTVQRAMHLLKREGYVYSVQGRGTFVRERAANSEGSAAQRGGGAARAAENPPNESYDGPVAEPALTEPVTALSSELAVLTEQIAALAVECSALRGLIRNMTPQSGRG